MSVSIKKWRLVDVLPQYVGPIHGRFLLAAAVSTTLGPALILNLRKLAETKEGFTKGIVQFYSSRLFNLKDTKNTKNMYDFIFFHFWNLPKALADLLTKVDPQAFSAKFGAELSSAESLIEAKTLTISKLMTIMPQGTVDPSPFLYNNTMYTMAGLVSVASILHFLVTPVNKKYFEDVSENRNVWSLNTDLDIWGTDFWGYHKW